jgi:hypothetical protein
MINVDYRGVILETSGESERRKLNDVSARGLTFYRAGWCQVIRADSESP